MKFSSKVEKCGLSPMRKFHPYAVAARLPTHCMAMLGRPTV